MGVRGLTTFIAQNNDIFLKDFFLHDSNLIIDGHNLAAQLYRTFTFFSAFGGDYDRFANFVREFFNTLKKCHVTPYVLFDGSYEIRKLKTTFCRHRSKISGASRLNPGNQKNLQIFPLLLRDVFREVLCDLKIQFTVCEYEADDEIAAMARYLSCPVLSYDSDFFIYNVLYIPYITVNHKIAVRYINGKKIYGMECKLYEVANFLNHFGGLKEEMLPLFATLMGNDYVEKRVFRNFFSHLKLTKSRKKVNEQQRSIQSLLEWLRKETLENAVMKIIGRLKGPDKQRVLKIINKTCDGYHKQQCESLKYFNLDIEFQDVNRLPTVKVKDKFILTTSKSEEICDDASDSESQPSASESTISESDCQDDSIGETSTNSLPKWFIRGLRDGQIAQPYINLFTHSLYFGSPQAEDYGNDDSFLCATAILRYSYDLLTNFSSRNLVYVGRYQCRSQKFFLAPDIIRPPTEVLNTDHIFNFIQQFDFFNYFFKQKMPKLKIDELKSLPPDCQLFMLSVLWWARNCSVSMPQIYSLFICYIMLNIIDERTGTFRGHFFFNNKYSTKLEVLKKRPKSKLAEDEVLLNKNKVTYDDCLIAASRLLENFEMDNAMKNNPRIYDVTRVHSYAQFQCCIQQLNYLNLLTGLQLPIIRYSKVFNGMFVYNMYNKLMNRENPYFYIIQYLSGADTVVMFLKSMCDVYRNNADDLELNIAPTVGRITCRKKKRCGRGKKVVDTNRVKIVVDTDSASDYCDVNNAFNLLKSVVL